MKFLLFFWVLSTPLFAGQDVEDTTRIIAIDEKAQDFVLLTEWKVFSSETSKPFPMFLHAYHRDGSYRFFMELPLQAGLNRKTIGSVKYAKAALEELNRSLKNLKGQGFKLYDPSNLYSPSKKEWTWQGWTIESQEKPLPRKKGEVVQIQTQLIGKKSKVSKVLLPQAKLTSSLQISFTQLTGVYSLFGEEILVGLYTNAPQEVWAPGKDFWILDVKAWQ